MTSFSQNKATSSSKCARKRGGKVERERGIQERELEGGNLVISAEMVWALISAQKGLQIMGLIEGKASI